jgi:hypothetical protein
MFIVSYAKAVEVHFECFRNRGVRSSFSIVLSIELLLLTVFMISSGKFTRDGVISIGWEFYLLVALLALSMESSRQHETPL